MLTYILLTYIAGNQKVQTYHSKRSKDARKRKHMVLIIPRRPPPNSKNKRGVRKDSQKNIINTKRARGRKIHVIRETLYPNSLLY